MSAKEEAHERASLADAVRDTLFSQFSIQELQDLIRKSPSADSLDTASNASSASNTSVVATATKSVAHPKLMEQIVKLVQQNMSMPVTAPQLPPRATDPAGEEPPRKAARLQSQSAQEGQSAEPASQAARAAPAAKASGAPAAPAAQAAPPAQQASEASASATDASAIDATMTDALATSTKPSPPMPVTDATAAFQPLQPPPLPPLPLEPSAEPAMSIFNKMAAQARASQPPDLDLQTLFQEKPMTHQERRNAMMRFNRAANPDVQSHKDRPNAIDQRIVEAFSGSTSARTNWFNAWLNLDENTEKLLQIYLLDEEIQSSGKGKKWLWVVESDFPKYISNPVIRSTTLEVCKADPARNKANTDTAISHLPEATMYKILVNDEEYENEENRTTKARSLSLQVDQSQARRMAAFMPKSQTTASTDTPASAAAPAAPAAAPAVPTEGTAAPAAPAAAPATAENMVDLTKLSSSELKEVLKNKAREEQSNRKKDPELKKRLEREKKEKESQPISVAKKWVKGLRADLATCQELLKNLAKEAELKEHVKETYKNIFTQAEEALSQAKAEFTKFQDGILKIDTSDVEMENSKKFAELITSSEEMVQDFKSDATAAQGILSGLKSKRTAAQKKADKAFKATEAEAATNLMR